MRKDNMDANELVRDRVNKGLCPLCAKPIKEGEKVAMIAYGNEGVKVHERHIPQKVQENILGGLGEKKD